MTLPLCFIEDTNFNKDRRLKVGYQKQKPSTSMKN